MFSARTRLRETVELSRSELQSNADFWHWRSAKQSLAQRVLISAYLVIVASGLSLKTTVYPEN
jgi:hypothetical protein